MPRMKVYRTPPGGSGGCDNVEGSRFALVKRTSCGPTSLIWRGSLTISWWRASRSSTPSGRRPAR
eukprot:297173-Prymnesium_polylepis.1